MVAAAPLIKSNNVGGRLFPGEGDHQCAMRPKTSAKARAPLPKARFQDKPPQAGFDRRDLSAPAHGACPPFGLCPYREHALISQQEHEAWDVLLACQSQLRLAPSVHVVGVDMHAALHLAAARGHDIAVLSELLPPAEAGFVEALCALTRIDPVES
jgi:hypothetical protein